jgi:hypothetical protein
LRISNLARAEGHGVCHAITGGSIHVKKSRTPLLIKRRRRTPWLGLAKAKRQVHLAIIACNRDSQWRMQTA